MLAVTASTAIVTELVADLFFIEFDTSSHASHLIIHIVVIGTSIHFKLLMIVRSIIIILNNLWAAWGTSAAATS